MPIIEPDLSSDTVRKRLRERVGSTPFLLPEGFIPASVLVPFLFLEEGPHLLFIRRPETLREHPGQIAFPGGRMEKGEDPKTTALREFEEEIGERAEQVSLFGVLPSVPSMTGYWIFPVVGEILPPKKTFPSFSRKEVEEVFVLPLLSFFRPDAYRYTPTRIHGREDRIDSFTIPGENGPVIIWGATGRVLRQLFLTLFPERFPS